MAHRRDELASTTFAGATRGMSADVERLARERTRRALYRADGTLAGTEDREVWHVWRQPHALPPGGAAGAAPLGLWASLKEFMLLFAGVHAMFGVAVVGGCITHWAWGNPVIGYVVVWLLIYVFGIRAHL